MEIYGFDCTGGVTSLFKDNPNLTEREVKEIADKDKANPINIFPNPFLESITISVYNDKSQAVYVDVVDIQGRILEVLENKNFPVGTLTYTYSSKHS